MEKRGPENEKKIFREFLKDDQKKKFGRKLRKNKIGIKGENFSQKRNW